MVDRLAKKRAAFGQMPFSNTPHSARRIIWLPKRFGHFAIEIQEEKALQVFIEEAFA